MRKQLFILGLAGLALASCSNDEQIAESAAADAGEITMRAIVPNATRGAAMTTGELNKSGQSIKAACYKSDASGSNFTEYYTNEIFSYDGTSQFTCTNRHRYPDDANVKLHHYAWYPTSASATISDASQSFANFTPAATVASQVDLMLAINKTSTNADKPTGTNLKFQHALSQIVVKAKTGSEAEFDFKIGGMKLVNVLKSGTCTWPAVTASTAKIPLSAWWSTQPAHADANIATYEIESFTEGYTATLTSTATALGAGNNGNFLVVPQDNTSAAWDPASATTSKGTALAVKLKILKKGTTTVVTDNEANGVTDGVVWAYVPINTKWEPGYKYIYTLDFNTGAGYTEGGDPILDKVIRYNCTIEEWVEATQPDVDLSAGN